MISTSVSGDGLPRQLDDRVGPCSPGAALRHANLDDLALSEQRHRTAVRDQALPVEAALDDVQLASSKPCLRAVARMASAASLTSNGSSPDTR
jgi:hypothetical protein